MNQVILYPLSVILLISSISDLRYQRIPNWLTFGAMAAGMAVNGFLAGTGGLVNSAGGMLLGTGIFIIPYAMGGMGAGDAKLMGAVGSFLGIKGVFAAALLAMLVGGVYAVFLMIRHSAHGRKIISGFKDSLVALVLMRKFDAFAADRVHGKEENRPRLCYGLAIAGGTFIYMIIRASGRGFLMF